MRNLRISFSGAAMFPPFARRRKTMPEPAKKALPSHLELRRKISVKEAAKLNDVCEDTFRRRYPQLIVRISPRRDAVALGDALAVGTPK
jgi:hypothetical protein